LIVAVVVAYKSLLRKDLTRSYGADPAVWRPEQSCKSCQQVPMNHGDLLLCRYLRGREVQRELPSTITYSQKFRGSAQRKSAQSFCRILCFFRLQVPMNHGDLLVFRYALFGRGVQRQLPSIITNGRNLVLMSQKKMSRLPQICFLCEFWAETASEKES
jgi:hypothetical protein